jgi:hypothetical protein
MDGGANICLTGVLDLLVDVVTIAPLPISVATKTGDFSMDDCCTKKGLIPLTLTDGSVYYQPCYYCKNAVETIISPQAILASSDVLVRWTQTGHKDGSPGMIRFDSDSGLFSIAMYLENRDGLYSALLTSLRLTVTLSDAMLPSFIVPLFPRPLSSDGQRIIAGYPISVSLNPNFGCSGSAHRAKTSLICFIAR